MTPSGEKRKIRPLQELDADFERARGLSVCPQKILDEMRNKLDHESSELDIISRFLDEARSRVSRKRAKLEEAKYRPLMLSKFAELQREWFDHPDTVAKMRAGTPQNLELFFLTKTARAYDIQPPPPDPWLEMTYDEANALVRKYVAAHKFAAAAMNWRMPGSRECAQVLRLSSLDGNLQIFVRYTLLDVASPKKHVDDDSNDRLTRQITLCDISWQTELVVQVCGVCVRKIVDVGFPRKTHDVPMCRGDAALLTPEMRALVPGEESTPDDHYRFLRALMSIFSYLMLARGFWLDGPLEFVAVRGFPTPFDSRS